MFLLLCHGRCVTIWKAGLEYLPLYDAICLSQVDLACIYLFNVSIVNVLVLYYHYI